MSQEPSVLVVDDEPVVRQVCEQVLKRHNFRPVLAENGHTALEIYCAASSELALIISDLSMPGMDGPTLIRKIFEHNPNAIVILMTGFSANNVVPGDLKRICATIQKLFTASQLIETVKRCLNYRALHGSTAT